jgi:uncharacterized protein YlxP (DUF503 family)
MVVGAMEVRLLVRDSRSLKDKRQVVRSVVDRLRDGFHVAAGEVDTLDDLRVITLGVAAVGSEVGAVKGLLTKIADALRAHPIAEFLGVELSVGSEVV